MGLCGGGFKFGIRCTALTKTHIPLSQRGEVAFNWCWVLGSCWVLGMGRHGCQRPVQLQIGKTSCLEIRQPQYCDTTIRSCWSSSGPSWPNGTNTASSSGRRSLFLWIGRETFEGSDRRMKAEVAVGCRKGAAGAKKVCWWVGKGPEGKDRGNGRL